jgi:hypothetical protein
MLRRKAKKNKVERRHQITEFLSRRKRYTTTFPFMIRIVTFFLFFSPQKLLPSNSENDQQPQSFIFFSTFYSFISHQFVLQGFWKSTVGCVESFRINCVPIKTVTETKGKRNKKTFQIKAKPIKKKIIKYQKSKSKKKP